MGTLNLAPLDLAHWSDRLTSRNTDGQLRAIGLAGDLARVIKRPGALPGAWIMPAQEIGSAPADAPQLIQRIRVRVSVIIALQTYGDTSGSRSLDHLRPLRSLVWHAFIGWVPPDTQFGVQFVSGRRLEPTENAMWWEDIFETSFAMRKTA